MNQLAPPTNLAIEKSYFPLGCLHNPFAIPEMITAIPHWYPYIGRRIASKSKPGEYRFAKIPRQINNITKYASYLKPSHYGEFDLALERLVKRKNYFILHSRANGCEGLFGLGFVLSKSINIIAYDLDNVFCENTEDVKPEAIQIVTEVDCYTEWSPSGKGLRILVEGQLPGGRVDVKLLSGLGLEIYDRDQFVTITGNQFYV